MDRLRNWFGIAWDFLVFVGESIWVEAVYTWKSLVVLAKWRVPFLDWLNAWLAFSIIYAGWLAASSFQYGFTSVVTGEEGYAAGAGGYLIAFIWYLFYCLDRSYSRRLNSLFRNYGDDMSKIAADLLEDNKLMLHRIRAMEEAQAAAVEQQKQPGQSEPAAPAEETINPPTP